MIKKLCTLFATALLVVPAMAQLGNSNDGASFRPQKGDWQVSINLGKGQFFNELSGMNYLLPTYISQYQTTMPDIGLGQGSSANQSQDMGIYLDLSGSFNDNSLLNVASFQGAYFLTDNIQLNATFSLDLSVTPKRDYIESGYYESGDPLNLPGYKYMEGRITSKWMLGFGGNYYFPTKNERINLYSGAMIGFQMGRVEASAPYSGETIKDNVSDEEANAGSEVLEDGEMSGEPIELYRPSNRAGTVWGIRGALVGGVEFSLYKGLVLGLEIHPVAYNYSVLRIQPQGMASYNCSHHNIRVFEYPTLKLGFRF